MQLGVRGHTDGEVVHGAHGFDQLCGVGEVAARIGAVGRRVPGERQHVVHAVGGVVGEQLVDLGAV